MRESRYIQLAIFPTISTSRRDRGSEKERERERRVIAAALCGQIKFKRMTRTLVSRTRNNGLLNTLEDLSRRLLTLRCTVDGTMENCAAAAAAVAK